MDDEPRTQRCEASCDLCCLRGGERRSGSQEARPLAGARLALCCLLAFVLPVVALGIGSLTGGHDALRQASGGVAGLAAGCSVAVLALAFTATSNRGGGRR